MGEPIEDVYFNWLCSKVMYDEPGRTVGLLRVMHETEFIWQHPADESRAMDGMDLREDFLLESGYRDPWDPLGCSVLEMLVAFSFRAESLAEETPKYWFWMMMQHLRLDEYRIVRPEDVPTIADVLYTMVWRTYSEDGTGGLWPLHHPKEDQRKVDIWYQFCNWLEEQNLP